MGYVLIAIVVVLLIGMAVVAFSTVRTRKTEDSVRAFDEKVNEFLRENEFEPDSVFEFSNAYFNEATDWLQGHMIRLITEQGGDRLAIFTNKGVQRAFSKGDVVRFEAIADNHVLRDLYEAIDEESDDYVTDMKIGFTVRNMTPGRLDLPMISRKTMKKETDYKAAVGFIKNIDSMLR